jgi:hypothetical protein
VPPSCFSCFLFPLIFLFGPFFTYFILSTAYWLGEIKALQNFNSHRKARTYTRTPSRARTHELIGSVPFLLVLISYIDPDCKLKISIDLRLRKLRIMEML